MFQLPPYFEALNEDYRYQLTAIGAGAPDVHIKEKLVGGRFVIAGARASQEICWQVTGTRKDPYAKARGSVTERDKGPSEKGFYRHPEVYGLPDSMGIFHKSRQRKPQPGPNEDSQQA